ncbi:MAG: low molecular weight phosphotyrosine protein phosphatase [Gammaproteobacteria bacterium]|nr:low molecular weight phosphotyrosine protein phosphatase [Gammaproteobacteria bacterium]
MTKVLFVCMGNICRSPTAEGVFRQLVQTEMPELVVKIDSAGTHAYHTGEPPDKRSQRAARLRGIDLSDIRARRVHEGDFVEFDYVLAMDESNFADLHVMCPAEYRSKLRLFMEFASAPNDLNVPDPYYGGANGFERVLDLVESASKGLLKEVQNFKKNPA